MLCADIHQREGEYDPSSEDNLLDDANREAGARWRKRFG